MKIAYEETALRARLKAAAARWNHTQTRWLTTGQIVRRLALHDRIVGWLETE